jgi:outer membrane protein FlgP
MKHSLILAVLLGVSTFAADQVAQATPTLAQIPAQPSSIKVVCPNGNCSQTSEVQKVEVVNPIELAQRSKVQDDDTLEENANLRIGVVGQGVAPMNTDSPAQAYALAKRAAVADAYRLIAEKVKGVRIEGDDLIKNMMVKRSTVRTTVSAMIRNANVVETTFKDGLCEVEMEITLSHADFAR